MTAIVDSVFEFLDEGDRVGALKLVHLTCDSFSDEELLRVTIRLKKEGVLFGAPKILERLRDSQGSLFGIPKLAESLGITLGLFGASKGIVDEVPNRALTERSPTEQSLDFFIYPSLRGASRALEVFLNLHPQIHVAPRIQTDRAFESGEWDGLVRESEVLRKHVPNLKSGLVLHGGGGSLRTFLGVTSLLAPNKPWIHVVREPFSAILSNVNHTIHGMSHGYSFAKMKLPWHLMDDVSKANAADFKVPVITDPVPSTIDELVQISAELKQDYRFGMPYAKYFENWSVVDYDELSTNRVNAGMAYIFSALGVDPSFQHVWFQEKMHGKLPRFFYNNPTIVSIFDYGFTIMLGLPGDNVRCHDLKVPPNMRLGEYLEIAQVQNNGMLAEVGVPGGNVVLLAEIESWFAMPRKIRLHLITSGLLQRYALETLIPRWVSNVAGIMQWITPAEVDCLTLEQRDAAYHVFRDDYERFLAQHPMLAETWQNG